MVDGETAPGPGVMERGAPTGRVPTWDEVEQLVIMSVPDDGVVHGTSGRAVVTVAQVVIETLSAAGVRALIEGLDARGSLREPPRRMATPCSVLTAETATGDTVATWGLDMAADRWLHETFQMRAPRNLGPVLVTLPRGREMVYPQVAHGATQDGQRDWLRIRSGLSVSTRGRRGRVVDPHDPFGGYDYAQE